MASGKGPRSLGTKGNVSRISPSWRLVTSQSLLDLVRLQTRRRAPDSESLLIAVNVQYRYSTHLHDCHIFVEETATRNQILIPPIWLQVKITMRG